MIKETDPFKDFFLKFLSDSTIFAFRHLFYLFFCVFIKIWICYTSCDDSDVFYWVSAETWPFVISILIQCVALEVSSSKKRVPKLSFAKTLRIVVQRAEDTKFSG